MKPGRVGIAHHCLMSSASVTGRIQRFTAMFDPWLSIRLGVSVSKPMMLFAGNSGGQCPPYIRTTQYFAPSGLSRLLMVDDRVSAFEIVLAGDPTCRGDRRSPGAGAKPAGQAIMGAGEKRPRQSVR
ncbi:MAG: hypothetical protein VR64_06270 [Desulfatitalea sp. BRH_c12]|nr:MAG: hypothetical protein VR64_06270 [Desulfatitalea sp. BRH_c12]